MEHWMDVRGGRDLPSWYRKAKLGLFVHWGAYSVPAWAQPVGELGAVPDQMWYRNSAYAEWYYNTIRFDDNEARAFHRAEYGDCDYYELLDRWGAERFDADALLESFRRAGATYAVITTKHHDGITLWPATGTDDLNTVVRGPKRDLVREFADACLRAGIKFGAYYSGGLDWHVRPMQVLVSHEDVDVHGRPKDADYAGYAFDHVKELIDNYQPSMLWNDIDWPDEGKNFGPKGLGTLFRYFFANRPDAVVNDRWGDTYADYQTSEYQHRLDSEAASVWEHTRGIGLSFGYNRNETAAHTLSPADAVRELIDVGCRGGRLLLNVGLKANGEVPELQQRVLDGLAAWDEACGSAFAEVEPESPAERIHSDVPWVRSARHPLGRAIFVDGDDRRVLISHAQVGDVVRVVSAGQCLATLTADGLDIVLDASRVGPAAIVLS